jgi:hypothetical protein
MNAWPTPVTVDAVFHMHEITKIYHMGDVTVHALRGVTRLVEPSGFTKVSALGVEEKRVNAIADFIDRPERLGGRKNAAL